MNPKLHNFLTIGFDIANVNWKRSIRSRKCFNKHQEQEWRCTFVIHPLAAYDMWELIENNKEKTTMKHLLWTLAFMRSKDSMKKVASNLNVDRNTLTKWTNIVFKLINKKYSKIIHWDNRLINCAPNFPVKTTTDCTDCQTFDHLKDGFDSGFNSHKFNHPAYRYEICVAIYSDNICWISGPFRAGTWQDRKLFKRPTGLEQLLKTSGEKTVADNIYINSEQVACKSKGSRSWKRWKRRVLSRHESVNSRLKNFGKLSTPFWCSEEKHETMFNFAAVATNIDFAYRPLMEAFV